MNNPVLDPLAVLPLDIRLYMYIWVLYLKEFSYKMFSWTMEKAWYKLGRFFFPYKVSVWLRVESVFMFYLSFSEKVV